MPKITFWRVKKPYEAKTGKNMVQYKRKPSIAYLELRLLLFVPGLPLVDNLAPK